MKTHVEPLRHLYFFAWGTRVSEKLHLIKKKNNVMGAHRCTDRPYITQLRNNNDLICRYTDVEHNITITTVYYNA